MSERVNQLLKRALEMKRKASLYEEAAESSAPLSMIVKNAVHFRELISGPGANEPLEVREQPVTSFSEVKSLSDGAVSLFHWFEIR